MEGPGEIKWFPSEMDVLKPATADATAPLRLLQCSYYQDVRALLILSSRWLCIPLTPSASKGKNEGNSETEMRHLQRAKLPLQLLVPALSSEG